MSTTFPNLHNVMLSGEPSSRLTGSRVFVATGSNDSDDYAAPTHTTLAEFIILNPPLGKARGTWTNAIVRYVSGYPDNRDCSLWVLSSYGGG